MKKCPYCAEEIQDEAIKCRFCGEFLEKRDKIKWCFKTPFIVIVFLCAGPLVLPLVWLNPHYSRKAKVVITLIALVVSYFMIMISVRSVKALIQYYELLFQSL